MNLTLRQRLSILTRLTRPLGNLIRLGTILLALIRDADILDVGSARVGDGSHVAEVLVDADHGLAVHGDDVADGHGALVHLVAVAAGAVELAEVVDGEAVDGDVAADVVLFSCQWCVSYIKWGEKDAHLDHLVLCALGSSAGDLEGASSLEGEGV